jgi:hypothetical protein
MLEALWAMTQLLIWTVIIGIPLVTIAVILRHTVIEAMIKKMQKDANLTLTIHLSFSILFVVALIMYVVYLG